MDVVAIQFSRRFEIEDWSLVFGYWWRVWRGEKRSCKSMN